MQPFFENLVDCMTESLFLQEFSRKYHYGEEQMALLTEVSSAMQKCIREDNQKQKAGWQINMPPRSVYCPVCITLGPGVDMLQESYLSRGLLTEGYMIETLGSELLLKAYPQWNDWVAARAKELNAERVNYRVRRYHFLGSEKQYPVEALPAILEKLQVPVTCTSAYCMLPKKSVAFYAELMKTESATAGDTFSCEGICAGCHSPNCPNRMEKQHTGSYDTDMTDRSFTYGYSRIFGIR